MRRALVELAHGALLVLCSASALSLAACGPSRDASFVRALAFGDRAKTAGRHLEAAAAYERAGRDAAREIDREYAFFLAAGSYARGQDRADAARLYEALAKTRGAHAARARYERALLTLETDEAAGVAELNSFVLETPSSALARPALAIVLDRGAKTPDERLALLERLAPRLRKTDLEERVRYEIALAHEARGERQRALEDLLRLATDFPYPGGALWDNALYRAAEIEDELGRPLAAIAHLERMLRERETTSLMGSYERPKYLPAARKVAELYRDRLGDRSKARDAYVRIFTEFKHSTARDDALFEAALLSVSLGDEQGACASLDKLTRTFPQSRYVACAPKICATQTAPKGAVCAPYIERKIRGTDANRHPPED